MNHATSHEMWEALPDHVKAKRRRQYPWMSDNGIRNYLWRRRDCINVVGA